MLLNCSDETMMSESCADQQEESLAKATQQTIFLIQREQSLLQSTDLFTSPDLERVKESETFLVELSKLQAKFLSIQNSQADPSIKER